MPSPAISRDLLVVLGDPIIELVADVPLADAHTFERRLGGQSMNLAMQSSLAGHPTALLTRFADDAFADWLLATWDEAGLHLDHARRTSGRNGVRLRGSHGTCLDRRDATPASGIDAAHAAALPWDLTQLVVATGEFQSLGGGAAAAICTTFEMAREAGAQTLFWPALTGDLWPDGPSAASAAFDELAGLIDVLVIGAPYASGRLLGQPGAAAAVTEALRRGVQSCVVIQASQTVVFGSSDSAGKVETMDGWSEQALGRLVVALAGAQPLADAVGQAVSA